MTGLTTASREAGIAGSGSDDLTATRYTTATYLNKFFPPSEGYLHYDADTGLFEWVESTNIVYTGYTAGSVLFLDSSLQIAEDNANFFWDDTNNRLGLTTVTPASTLDIGTNELTCGSINRATGTLTLEIGGTAEQSITATETTFGGNIVIPDAGYIGSVTTPDAIQIEADGDIVFTQSLYMANESYIYWKNAGGSNEPVLYVDSGDDVYLGATQNKLDDVHIYCGDNHTIYLEDWSGTLLALVTTGSTLYSNLDVSGTLSLSTSTAAALTIGNGSAGIDYILTFNGQTNDGTLTYMEDEDRLDLSMILQLDADQINDSGGSWITSDGSQNTTLAGNLTLGDKTLVVDTTTLVVNAPSYTDKVGIGTATPAWQLHVVGNQNIAQFSHSSGNPKIMVGSTQTSNYLQLGAWDACYIRTFQDIDMNFLTNNTLRLKLDSSHVHISTNSIADSGGSAWISSDGSQVTTFGGSIIIPDAGNIGSVSDPDSIQIEADGDIVLTQELYMQNDKGIWMKGDGGTYCNVMELEDHLYIGDWGGYGEVDDVNIFCGTSQAIVLQDDATGFASFSDSGDILYIPTIISTNTAAALTIGNGSAGIDYILTFNGETNDGTITYMEDEDRIDFNNDVKVGGDLTVNGNDIKDSGGSAALTFDGSSTLATFPGSVETVKNKLTALGGLAIKLTNKTGSNTVQGQLVKADTANNDAVILTAISDTECFGVFLEGGIADGSEAWVVVSGICDVAMEDNTAATRGNWVQVSDNEAGYADATGASPAASPNHFKEIGHCIETVAAGGAGTHILARCVIHFL